MTRHLIIRSDGESIDAVLTGLTDADALLNLAMIDPAGTAVTIDPANDTGAHIDNGVVKYDPVDGLVLIADGSPAPSLTDFNLAEVVAP